MQLHELKRKTPHQGSKRVGRGRASGKGKTAGRGTKGQKARAGHKIWPNVREQLKKLPKRRGYSFQSIKDKPVVVNVGVLEAFFAAGDAVTPQVLLERRVVRSPRAKSKGAIAVKILGDGELTKKLSVSGCQVSTSAKEKIEKAGGTVAA
jgi:large subunit ribosomal protein L15